MNKIFIKQTVKYNIKLNLNSGNSWPKKWSKRSENQNIIKNVLFIYYLMTDVNESRFDLGCSFWMSYGLNK